MPQIVGVDRSVKGLDAFFVEPSLTPSVILGQLLKVGPTGNLEQRRDETQTR